VLGIGPKSLMGARIAGTNPTLSAITSFRHQ
jgi:hypothetical protein